MTETLTVDADRITITDARCHRCKLLVNGAFGDRDSVCHCLSEPHYSTRSAVIVVDGPEQVRRLTEPCDTCWGNQVEPLLDKDGDLAGWSDDPCPDCRDGKPTFRLNRLVPGFKHIKTELGGGWVITDVQPRDDGMFAVFAEQNQ